MPTQDTASELVRAIAQATGQTERQVKRELIRRAARGYACEVLGPAQAASVENASRQRQEAEQRRRDELQAQKAAQAATRARIRAEWESGRHDTQKQLAQALGVPTTVVNDVVGGVRFTARLEDVTPEILRMADSGKPMAEIVQAVRELTGITRSTLPRQVRKIARQQGEK